MVRLAAVVALLLGAGCDSFRPACTGPDDCPTDSLCRDGECLAATPVLIARCAADEVCNGVDDDCDGALDEGCAAGDACTAGFGICARAGALSAADGGLLCDVEPGPPADESCNGLDDDCDGVADESCQAGALCGVGRGACRVDGRIVIEAGVRTCVDPSTGLPAVPGEPEVEICGDRIDNDCDGETEEDFVGRLGQPCSSGLGACAATGVTICLDAEVQCSARAGLPEPEMCDRRDNDCDGITDEDFGTEEPCTNGVGACESSGIVICNPTRDGAMCNAVPRSPSAERCNGVDDDCDGVSDELFSLGAACADGMGRAGVCVCGPAEGAACEVQIGGSPQVLPPREQPDNGIDDDCDGVVDEAA